MTSTPTTKRPSEDYLSGLAEGVRRGLAKADSDPGPADDRCPTPPLSEQRPLAGGRDDLASQDRLSGSDRPNGDD